MQEAARCTSISPSFEAKGDGVDAIAWSFSTTNKQGKINGKMYFANKSFFGLFVSRGGPPKSKKTRRFLFHHHPASTHPAVVCGMRAMQLHR
jgi:hypothetical protein